MAIVLVVGADRVAVAVGMVISVTAVAACVGRQPLLVSGSWLQYLWLVLVHDPIEQGLCSL